MWFLRANCGLFFTIINPNHNQKAETALQVTGNSILTWSYSALADIDEATLTNRPNQLKFGYDFIRLAQLWWENTIDYIL